MFVSHFTSQFFLEKYDPYILGVLILSVLPSEGSTFHYKGLLQALETFVWEPSFHNICGSSRLN